MIIKTYKLFILLTYSFEKNNLNTLNKKNYIFFFMDFSKYNIIKILIYL